MDNGEYNGMDRAYDKYGLDIGLRSVTVGKEPACGDNCIANLNLNFFKMKWNYSYSIISQQLVKQSDCIAYFQNCIFPQTVWRRVILDLKWPTSTILMLETSIMGKGLDFFNDIEI